MKNVRIIFLLVAVIGIGQSLEQTETTTKRTVAPKTLGSHRCEKLKNEQHLCCCGKERLIYDRLRGETCRKGKIVQQVSQKAYNTPIAGLRLPVSIIHRSTREDKVDARFMALRIKDRKAFVPLRNVSVETWIHTFAADVTLTQVYVNEEGSPIEAIYVFPIEENAAIYAFTAEIDNRLITAVLKEKKAAEAEYDNAVQQGQTAVLLRQSEKTLDTFRVNVGALPPGKECIVKIRYVTELDLIDGNAIRFVVPTTVAPRYSPQLGHLQSPDNTEAAYVQKTPYSISFQAHIDRNEQNKIMQVSNLSHSVNVSLSSQTIDVSLEGLAFDRDIILDIDLPYSRSSILVAVEEYDNSTKQAVLTALTPHRSHFVNLFEEQNETTIEYILIVDCSGSMRGNNGIGLARQAMLLFVRSIPVDSHFNIIRFGSDYKILFNNETMTVVYDEKTAKLAETFSQAMEADLGGTELLKPLQYLKDHPPGQGRSRQVFLLTDGEISNTDQVIELCQSMSLTTRIFSFGVGDSPSRSLVKGLARATNGHFVFVPPGSKVDVYVGNQLRRAIQPSLTNARLQWYGLSSNGSQAPDAIPPMYPNDRVLVYTLLKSTDFTDQTARVDFLVGEHKMGTVKLSDETTRKGNAIHRLAAKALIQNLQHAEKEGSVARITALSLTHQILSPYTTFVGVETTNMKYSSVSSQVRHVPIQISKDNEHLFSSASIHSFSIPHPPTRPARFRSKEQRKGPMPAVHSYYAIVGRGRAESGSVQTTTVSSQVRHVPIQISKDDEHLFSSASIHSFSIPHPPTRPARFRSKEQRKGYIPAVHSYYAIVGRGRAESGSVQTTTVSLSLLATDPVRWLIEQQSFNGAWTLSENQIQKLTNGKTLDTFKSTISQDSAIVTTALAIALLESKYADQHSLWYMIVEKARKWLLNFGLNKDKVDLLIREMKNKL